MYSKKQISIVLGHAVNIPATSSGGVEKVFEDIFYKWDDTNFEYTLICKGDVKKDEIEQVAFNKRIIKLKGYKWYSSKFLNVGLSFFWCLKTKKHLRHADFIIYNSVFGPLLHKIIRFKGLVSYCDQRGTGKVNYLIPSKSLDRLYAISKVVENGWNKKYSDKIKIIPNCVDVDLFKFVDRYEKENKDYNILFIGRIINEKGLLLLLQAIKILLDKYKLSSIKLNIIGPSEAEKGGDPIYFNKCQDFVNGNNLNNYINFLGEKTSNEIINYLSVSNIFIMSSIWEEAFGIVNIEALATGLPIVGFKKGALPEIIQNTQEGFIAYEISPQALADGIFNHYSLNIKEKILMEKKCRARAVNYDSREVAELYLNDIKQFLTK